MSEIRNVVTFQAPFSKSEGLPSLDGLFDAESVISETLATQLRNNALEVGSAFRNVKISSITYSVAVDGKRFWMDVGYDNSTREWTVLVRSRRELKSLIVGRTGFAEMEKVCKAIDAGLRANNDVTNIEWKTVDEWLRQGKRRQAFS